MGMKNEMKKTVAGAWCLAPGAVKSLALVAALFIGATAEAAYTQGAKVNISQGASITINNYNGTAATWTPGLNSSTTFNGQTSFRDYQVSGTPTTSTKNFALTITNNGATQGAYAFARRGSSGSNGFYYQLAVVDPLRIKKGGDSGNLGTGTQTYSWLSGSSDTGVATVDDVTSNSRHYFKITGKAVGDAVCWATNRTTSSGYYAYKVTVYEEVDTDDQTVNVGQKLTDLTITASKAGTWSATSSDESVATVSVSGSALKVYPTITAGDKTGTTTVKVWNDYCETTFKVNVIKPSADPVNVPLTEGGKTYTPELSGAVVSANSSNVQVAEVDEKTGAIKPMWLGDATVTIEDAEYIRTYNVTVTNTKTTQLNIDLDTESSKKLTFPSGEGMYWTVSKDDPYGVIALDKSGQTTAATQTFELKVTPNKTGKATFKVVAEKTMGMTRVKYGDYTYNVWVTATPSGDRQSTATLKVDGDATITCPSKCSETKATWTIKSGYDEAEKAIATLSVVNPDGGTVKPQVKVTKALKPGLIHLVIGNDKDDHTWTLDIVVKKYVVEVLELDTSKDETRVRELTCEGDLAGAWGASSTYESVARAEIVGETTDKTCKVKVIGISEGKTVITVQNEFATYEYTVSVKGEYVPSTEKTVDYTYTDEAGKVQKAMIGYEGATVSWAPSADGKNTDLVLIFTNTADISKLEIPSPKIFRARILAVGGGGAGGSQALPGLGGGGGGAGGYMENDNALLSAGFFYVTVGEGGRAAEEKFVASTGMNGGISVVTNSAGQVLASAIGGGGGGASISKAIGGQSGGSGGGGAWVNDFSTTGGNGAGGNGRDGQGHRGGKPADEPENFNNGGGGGGACVASNKVNGVWIFLGEGGTHGEAGLGATNDITGVALEYARGGVGGKNNSTAKAADGADGRGNGGAGGNGGFGGKGGDGVVIIRLTSVFENVQVPKPTVANQGLNTESKKLVDEAISEFEFKDSYGGYPGHPFTSFNTEAEVPGLGGKKYKDIVKYVDGCPATNAWMTKEGPSGNQTNVYHNIGHYQYVVYLKDGYSWIDGSPYGSTSGCLIDWRITKDLNSVDATIRVEKSVTWAEDGSNAVITITSHSTPAQNPVTPRVLFMGGLCNYHNLEKGTVVNSLTAVAANADVDWFLYKNPSQSSGPNNMSGSLKRGDTYTWSGGTADLQGNNHQILHHFIDCIYENVVNNKDPEKQYDYIVLEFDGSRIAVDYGNTSHPGNIEKETAVAEVLEDYYAKGRVLWITDDWGHSESGQCGRYPWDPEKGENSYYRPTSFCSSGNDGTKALTADQWRGLVAILDPKHYKTSWSDSEKVLASTVYYCTTTQTGGKYTTATRAGSSTANPPDTYWSADKNTNQVHYVNSDEVVAFLKSTIKPVAYNLAFYDKIMADVGLSLTGLKFSCATNDLAIDSDEWWEMVTWDAANPDVFDRTGEKHWTTLVPELGSLNIKLTSVDTTSNRVEVTMTNMWIETWAKIDIGLVDDGTFKTSVDATYNSVTGQWEKNPNEGKAAVAMIKEDGTRTEVKGEAATAAAWKFSTYDVTAEAVNGEIFLNGIRTNWTAFCEGYSPIVSYRGKPGYDLVKLYVDTDLYTQGDFNDENRVYTLFSQLAGNHSVRAEYEAYVEEIVDAPSTNTYDAAGHVFPVRVKVADGVDYEIDVRYAFAADKDDPEKYLTATNFCVVNREALKDVGPHEIYYKVFALQQGYGASIDQKGWVEVGVKGREVGGGVNTNWVEAATLYAYAGSTYIKSTDTEWSITNGAPITYRGFVTNTIGGVEYAEDATNALDFYGKTAQQCLACEKFVSGGTSKGTYPIVITSGAITAKDKTTGVTGNYIIKTHSGTLYVDGVPFVINGRPQDGSEDPEDQNGPIAVKSVSKVYDGNPTSIVLRVDFPEDFPSDDPQYKSVFKFAWSEECPGEGDWQDTLPEFTNVVTKAKVWYLLEDTRCITAITNYAYVTIEPRPITLNSPDASKEFDGNALHTTDEQCWISEDTLLVEGDEIKMRNVTWQMTVTTEPVSNKFTYEFTKGDPNNYKVTVNEGGLTVTKGGLTIGRPGADREDEDYPVKYPIDQNPRLRPPVATNGVASVVKTYDGQPTNITVYAFNPKNGNLPVEGLVYLYTTNANDAASWKPTLGLTDVTGEDGAGVGVWFSINDPQGNWASVTNMAFVTILPKAATVTAASDEKTYDGEELVEGGYKADGFIEGEGVKSVTMTADSRIINAGTTNNVIDVIEPLAGTKLTNYAITKVPGVLKINPKPLTLHSRNKSETWEENGTKELKVEVGDIWDGTPELEGTEDDDYYVKGERFAYGDFAAVTNNEIQVVNASFSYADNGKALVSNYIVTEDFGFLTIGGTTIHIGGKDTKDGEEPGDPWVKPVDVFYNGKGHAIEVDVTYPVDTSSLKFHYKSEATGGEWVDWNPQYTNVTGRAIEVWYAVDDTTPGRFASVTNCSTVTVRPRPITVKANDQTMTYGKDIPDLEDQFTVSNRVDDTYSVTLKYTNDVFNAGVCTNAIVTNAAITVAHPTLGDVTADYDITFIPGTLTVKKGAAPHFDVTSVTNVFNYKGTNVTVTAEDGNEIWWKVNGVWTRTPPAYTNVLWTHSEVDSYKVEFKVVDPSGNYEDAFGTGEVVINPLPITVTAESFTKTLGTPMPEFGWVETIDGTNPPERIPEEDRNRLTIRVDPDCRDLIPDGLDSTNYVIHVSGNRAQGNYIITYVDGTLTVTRKKRFGYKKLGEEVMYDGLGHRIEVAVTNEELVARANYGYSMTQLPADSKDWKSLEEMQAVTNASLVAGSPIYFRIMIDDGSEYETEIGNATVKVLPRPVMLKAADGEWPYDGNEHGTNGFEVLKDVPGYTNFVALEGRPAEGLKSVTMTKDSRIKEIGETNNVIQAGSEVRNEYTILSNYTFAYSNGVLRVTEGRKPMPLKSIPAVTNVYDGTGHIYVPEFGWDEDRPEPQQGVKVVYSLNEHGDDYAEDFCLTNVFNGGEPVTVYFKATAKGYFDTNGWSTVTITQRVATVTAKSASKTYDGKELTCNGFTTTGFVTDIPGRVEGVESVTMTKDSTVTDAGDPVSNKIETITWLKPYTDPGNYVVITNQGELSVTPYDGATVNVKGNTRTTVYTGAEQETNGWEFVSSSTNILKKEMITLKDGVSARAFGTDASEDRYEMGLTEDDFVCTSKNFSNVKFEVTDGWLKIDPADIGGFGAKDFGPYTYKGTPWEPTGEVVVTNAEGKALAFGTDYEIADYRDNVNATNKAIVVIAGEGNYTGTLEVPFAIKKAKVTVTPDDKTIVYGSPVPEADFYTMSYDGFVNGETEKTAEGFVAPTFTSAYTTKTPVGDIPITKATEASARNYEFDYETGTLTVENAALKLAAVPYNGQYDGLGHTVYDISYDPVEGTGIYFMTNGVSCGPVPPVYTNAGSYVVVTVATNANYEAKYVTNEVVIMRRKIELTSATDSKPYDGTPLMTKVTGVHGEGYAEPNGVKECFDYIELASVRDVGESKTAFFLCADGTAKLANYEIVSYHYGVISITGNGNEVAVRSASGTWVYDGEPHGTNDWEFVEGSKPLDETDDIYVTLKGQTVVAGVETNYFDTVVISNRETRADVTAKYGAIRKVEGLLTVTNAVLGVADPRAFDIEKFYDNVATNVNVDVPAPKGVGEVTVKYAPTADGPFGAKPEDFLNATNATVWYEASAEHCTPYTNFVTVLVKKRAVTIASHDKNATADELPLTLEKPYDFDVTTFDPQTGAGFVPGQDWKLTAAAKLETVGQKPAWFEYELDLDTGTLELNYSVTTNYGTLTAVPVGTLALKAKSGIWPFDNKAHELHECEYVSGLKDGHYLSLEYSGSVTYPSQGEVTNVIDTVVVTNAAGEDVTSEYAGHIETYPGRLVVTNVAFSAVGADGYDNVYDAREHKITVTATPVEGDTRSAKVTYAETYGGEHTGANPTYSNVVDRVVWYRVELDGYETVTNCAVLRIHSRPVTITTGSSSRPYDGTALSNGTYEVVAKADLNYGILPVHKLVAHTTTEIVNVEEKQNELDYDIVPQTGDLTVRGNYYVTTDLGWLKVTPFQVKVTITVEDKDYDATTNATYKSAVFAELTGGELPDGESLKLDADGMKFYFVDPNVGTWNVTNDVFQQSFVSTNAPGMLRGNYEIADVVVNQATIREIQAPNPDHEPGEEPGPGTDYPPEAGPFPGPDTGKPLPPASADWKLSDYDVVTNYDGEAHTFDTNKLFAKLAEIKDVYGKGGLYGNKYGVDYSTNGVDWVAEPYAWVNVADTPTSFWYRVSVTNMNPVIHAVGVTILPKEVDPEDGVQAKDATMTYGKYETLTKLTDQWYTLLDEGVLEDGDGIKSVQLAYTNDMEEVLEKLPVVEGGYEGFVSTNKKVAVAIVITNATGDVSANYRMGFKLGKLTINKDKPKVEPIKDDDDRIYDGTEQKPLTPGMVKTSEGVQIPEDEYKVEYHYNVHATNKTVNSGAYVVVTFTNNYDAVVTNYFSINRRPVWFKTPDHEFTYSGEAQSNRAVTVEGKGFVKAVDREVADGIVTNGFKAITTVSESGAKAEFFYDLAEGTLESDYEIRDPEWGTLTMVSAPTEPKTPPEERDPPEDPTPENPGDTDPPEEDEGKAVLWAPDVAKYYDGKGTNTEALVYFAKPEGYNSFTYEYTTNEDLTGWAENVLFTNVLTDAKGNVIPYKVYCRAVDDADNYVATNYLAYVTILPKVVSEAAGVQAKDATMTYGKYETLTKLTDQWYTLLDEGVLEDGDGIASVSLIYTNDVEKVLEKLPVVEGGYAGFVSTNKKVAVAIVITNATGDVSANYRMGFKPGKLTINKLHPEDTKVQAKDITIAYGENPGLPTEWKWTGVDPLVNGDEIENVPLWFTNGVDVSTLDVGMYENLISTNGIITVTNKAAGVDVTGNYELGFLAGNLNITNAVIAPKGPFGPGGGDPPGPDAGYPWVGATNVVMEYTGTNGTNVVVCWGGLKPPTLQPESILYTTNLESDVWSADLQFTNVFYDVEHGNCVTSQQVWFAVKFKNYDVLTNSAFVTILPTQMVFGPDAKGKNHPQDPKNPVPPNAYDDASGTSNGVMNVFAEWYEGISTNIVVNVVEPDPKTVEIHYGTNGVGGIVWDYECGPIVFTEPILSNVVWYAVSAPNYQTITNYGYVTIYKAEVEPVFPEDMDLSEEDKKLVEDSLKNAETNDDGYAEHAYIKYKLTYGEARKILDYGDETTRTTREWGPSIEDKGKLLLSFAEQVTGVDITTNYLYDVILERTYELWVAQENPPEWRNWTNLTESVSHSGTFIAVPIKYELPENKAFVGVFGMHGDEKYQFEEITAAEATEDGKLDPSQKGLHAYFVHDAANCKLTLYMRDFCPVQVDFKEAFKDALFTATLSWQYYDGTGSYYSYIKVTNTNDTDMIRYDRGTLRFCFADRIGANGTTLLALGDKIHRKNRWATTETINGITYRSYPLPDRDPSRPDGGWTKGASKPYGTTGALSDSVLKNNPSPEMFVYKRIAPEWGNEEAAWATEFVAWLVWNATDQGGTKRTYAIPLVAGKENLSVPGKAAFEGGPVSVGKVNENLAFGGAEDEVSLITTSFQIEGDTGRVRVAFLRGAGGVGVENGEMGALIDPGPNARVIVQGAEDLGGPFEDIGELKTEDGTAEFGLQGKQFFKVKAEALPVVK